MRAYGAVIGLGLAWLGGVMAILWLAAHPSQMQQQPADHSRIYLTPEVQWVCAPYKKGTEWLWSCNGAEVVKDRILADPPPDFKGESLHGQR